MTIDPQLQLALFLSSFLGGVAMGALFEVMLAARILLGAYAVPREMHALYLRPLPLLGRPVGLSRRGKARRFWRALVVAVLDLLFCTVFAVTVILVLYRYHSGAIRMAAPLLALLGFALFRLAAGRFFAFAVGYLAFFLSAAGRYLLAGLCLPLIGAWRLMDLVLFRPVRRLFARITAWRARRISRALCQRQLALAARGLRTGK